MKVLFFPMAGGIRGYLRNREVSVFIDEDGKKKIDGKQNKGRLFVNFPFIRGVLFFILGIFAFLKGFFDMIKILDADGLSNKPQQKFKIQKSSLIYACLFVVSLFFSVFLLGFLPSKLSFWLIGLSSNLFLRNFIIAIIKVIIILFIFLLLRFLPFMQELYKFNAAGNIVLKNKGEYKDNKNYHYPLNFLNYFLFTFILSVFVITLVGIRISFWLNWIINIAIFLGVISISYEILWLLTLNEKIEKLAVLTSFFVCIKPNLTHDEVARIAYSQLNLKEKAYGEKMEKGKIALSTVLTEMQTKLTKAGKYEKSDVEWIIATVLNKTRAEAKLVRFFDEKTYREIMKAASERASGKPLSAIFGFVEFYGLRFNVNKKVLAPRMETEILVEECLKSGEKIKKCDILDVGTGSGAIAVSVAKNSNMHVFAVDVSKQALDVAKENAKLNDVKIDFLQSDLFNDLKKGRKFDIIVSNPPYIRTLDIEGLDEEVKNFDPRLALDGGKDGLDFYRRIVIDAKKHFKKNGIILFEIGKGQFSQVKKILDQNGYTDIEGIKDYNKIYRVVKAVYGNK